MKYAIGKRETYVPIGFHAVDTPVCLDCHTRQNDRHPVYRFQEPRFTEAVAQIDATDCLTCHSEHNAERVSIEDVGYCVTCHEDLKLKSDPLDIPHVDLISNKDWGSCLACHDYHGNHVYNAPKHTNLQIDTADILEYLRSGPDPYSPTKTEKGKRP
jgi:hypothetical protein